MKIKKILNNNAVLIRDGQLKEAILIGTGIGFQKKPGDSAEQNKIDKIFVLRKKETLDRFSTLLENIPVKYVAIADDIISMAKEELDNELSDSIYISLTDHISNSLKLFEEGIASVSELSWEVKKFYPKEFQIGKKGIEIILERTGKELPESEAGNIALHLINSQLNTDLELIENTTKVTKKIKDILNIIRFTNKVELDENSLAYDRFVTHLRFFFKRIDCRREDYLDRGNFLLQQIKDKYRASYFTMRKIEEYLEVELNEDEQLYLCLHIQKLINSART